MSQLTARTDFTAAIKQIATERKISVESIIKSIEEAIDAAYYKDKYVSKEERDTISVEVDPNTGESHVYQTVGDEKKDVTPPGFGRIAAQTAKQVILQKIREAEKQSIIGDYEEKIGDIVSGMILRMQRRNVIVDIGRGHGIMPPEEQMRGEFYKMNTRITVYIKDIREIFKGKAIIVSRSDKNLVAKLFEREVPEVSSGSVEIKAVAREAGVRSKIAVHTEQTGVDPVGACVGQKGVRVQEVIKELNNEKIDIVPFSEDIKLYIAAALAPAESLVIEIDDEKKIATVTAPDDQLSLAIGRGGQNVRLAAKLTGYKITIQSAKGDTQASVTGEEEYEIDQVIQDIDEELRELLIKNRLTTIDDLRLRRQKWVENDQFSEEQQESIQQAIKAYEAEEERKRKEKEEAQEEQEVAEKKAKEEKKDHEESSNDEENQKDTKEEETPAQ